MQSGEPKSKSPPPLQPVIGEYGRTADETLAVRPINCCEVQGDRVGEGDTRGYEDDVTTFKHERVRRGSSLLM